MTHRLLLALALLATSAGCDRGAGTISATSATPSAPADAPGGARRIAIARPSAKIGDATRARQVETETTVTKTRGPKGGLHITKKTSRTADWKEECIALDVGRCNALRVRYEEDAEGSEEESVVVDLNEVPGGAPKRSATPKAAHVVQGKTYRVTLGKADAAVEREGSSKVDEDELKAIRKRFSRQERDREAEIEASLPAEVVVGQSLDATAKVFTRQLAAKLPDAKIDTTCTVRDIRDEGGRAVVVLAMKSGLSADTAKGALAIDIDATIELWADTGAEKLSVTQVDTKVTGKNGMEITVRGEDRVERTRLTSFDETAARGTAK